MFQDYDDYGDDDDNDNVDDDNVVDDDNFNDSDDENYGFYVYPTSMSIAYNNYVYS